VSKRLLISFDALAPKVAFFSLNLVFLIRC
jgi:CCR4-NOT transcription complex subunit 2